MRQRTDTGLPSEPPHAALAGSKRVTVAGPAQISRGAGALVPARRWSRPVEKIGLLLAVMITAAATGFGIFHLGSARSAKPPASLKHVPTAAELADARLVATQKAPPVEPVSVLPVTEDIARALNTAQPFSKEPNPPARPFHANFDPGSRARAIDCLASAGWFEAGTDWEGQRAVMQVVLNRVRHPSFPKDVCGVVYQGSERTTGCQFSFTCDGALSRTVPPSAWEKSQAVATAALDGAVYRPVGLATHYHTDWVKPLWSDAMDKITALRTHLFFRWPGAWGRPVAFRAAINPEEPAIAKLAALSAAHRAALAAGGPLAPADAAAAPAASGDPGDVSGSIAAYAPAELAAKPLRASRLRLVHPSGDAFVVTLGPSSPAGAYALDALDLCAGKLFCKVMGWIDGVEVPRGFPISADARARMAFVYIRQNGTDYVRWDCQQVHRAPAENCISDANGGFDSLSK